MNPASVLALVIALASAAIMGAAIQRGATCMVAAISDVVMARRYGRAGALTEAALWVGGLMAIAQLVDWPTAQLTTYRVTLATVGGGMLLGLGAWINKACVFGSVARISSGQWSWLATPVGFFLGCLLPLERPTQDTHASPQGFFFFAALVALALLGWRVMGVARAPNKRELHWNSHHATLVIALTFVSTLLTVGAWAYTDALAALARPDLGMDPLLVLRGIMVLALLGGAIVGGKLAKTFAPLSLRAEDLVRCLAGGAIMGLGAQLAPGGNDGLIMLGLPLLLPHAWVAVLAMALTISVLVTVGHRVAVR